ncbi:hypothetical protein ACSFA7_32450 [Variovorax sp. LT1R20]|uniref:hypothetical protein n=1 Tax=Variovorax sp. LT1R20 TaxID=3443729 RepID=UPI003F4873B2
MEPPSSPREAASVDYEAEPDEFDEVETQVGEDGLPSMLEESLDRAVASGDHRAHYVLALLLRQREDEFSAERSAHWYEVQQDGVELDGVEKEWADAFAATRKNAGLAEARGLFADLSLHIGRWALRDIFGFTRASSAAASRQCGACTAHLDGPPVH